MFSAGVADGEAAVLPARGPAPALSELAAEASRRAVSESLSSVPEVRAHARVQVFPGPAVSTKLAMICLLTVVGRQPQQGSY